MSPAAKLAAACKAFDAAAIARAITAGAEPDRSARGWTALAAVIQETVHGDDAPIPPAQRVACVAALLEGGADVRLRSGHPVAAPLVLAGLGGHSEVAKLLIERGAPLDRFAAAALGRRALLERRLASDPALARSRDDAGFTLLHFACGSRMGRTGARVAADLDALVARLLVHGADPNPGDADGLTAMHRAASRGNVAMWEALLAAGGDAERKAKGGVTPRTFAAARKWIGAAKAIRRRAEGSKRTSR